LIRWWIPVFRKDHAPSKNLNRNSGNRA
jgi:hypothetical protein